MLLQVSKSAYWAAFFNDPQTHGITRAFLIIHRSFEQKMASHRLLYFINLLFAQIKASVVSAGRNILELELDLSFYNSYINVYCVIETLLIYWRVFQGGLTTLSNWLQMAVLPKFFYTIAVFKFYNHHCLLVLMTTVVGTSSLSSPRFNQNLMILIV